MINPQSIREHMEIVGADGVHLGTVDKVEGDRIKMTLSDSGSHAGNQGLMFDEGQSQGQGSDGRGHHHYISLGLVAAIEEDRVRLSATARNAALFEEEEGGEALADFNRAASADDELDMVEDEGTANFDGARRGGPGGAGGDV